MSLTDLTLEEKKQLYYDFVENEMEEFLSIQERDYIKDLVIADIDAEEQRNNGN